MILTALRALVIVAGIVVLVPVLGLAYGYATTSTAPETPRADDDRPSPAAALAAQDGIEHYRRSREAMLLAYPLRSIAYAEREYADFVGSHSETDFPYWAYVGRFWKDYATMLRATASGPLDVDSHVVVVVAGTGHTLDLAVQSAWENVVGRVTETIAGWQKTQEDRFQSITAAEYAAFLDQRPWYRFPFSQKRTGLWGTSMASGPAVVRSLERKLAFGGAYTVKQILAAVSVSALPAGAAPSDEVHIWIGPAEAMPEADASLVKDLGDDGVVLASGRPHLLTDLVAGLVAQGALMVEIAGNDEILLTVLSNDEVPQPQGARELFAYQLPAEPFVRRTGMIVPVGRLHLILPELAAAEARLEQIHGY